jgi:glycosyltransferase involved in cell wall biosynthesis
MIDEIIQLEKPDIYIGVEDIWGFNGYWDKPWWNKINSIIWTTLDSLPILPDAVNAAPKIKHYYVWATFAQKALNELGYNVNTLRGSIDIQNFYKLPEQQRQNLRKNLNLNDEFIIGFVFRNQLRKSVPNLLDGFNLFVKNNPQSKAKLLLHTNWSEGWDIPRLLREKNIPTNSVLTTYVCHACGSYEVRPFTRQSMPCKSCKVENSQHTTSTVAGISESQLNEIYNLMDVYCHPFTSGGQEIPIQEAKLTELITLVTNYSCGEDNCTEDSGGFPLDWTEYREPGTQFIKASTSPESICSRIEQVFLMDEKTKQEIGAKARQWTIENFSTEVIGKKLEEIFDSMPDVNFENLFEEKRCNPNYKPADNLSNEDFIIDLYKNILNEQIDKNHAFFIEWMNQFRNGMTRDSLYQNIANQAIQKINQPKQIEFKDVLDQDDEGKRLAVVIPKSGGDVLMVNALLENLKSLYKDLNLYIFTEPKFFDLIRDNPAVHKVLPYSPICDNLLFLEGQGSHKGFFEIAFLPYITTQKIYGYHHNGKDKIQFSLK